MYPHPRVGVLDGEALRTLQKAGVYERAVPDMLLGAGAQWVSARGKVVATTLPTEKHQGHPWISAIYQPLLDRQLRAALAEYPDVDIRLGHRDDESVELTFHDVDDRIGNARARFVLGCDGANSATRGRDRRPTRRIRIHRYVAHPRREAAGAGHPHSVFSDDAGPSGAQSDRPTRRWWAPLGTQGNAVGGPRRDPYTTRCTAGDRRGCGPQHRGNLAPPHLHFPSQERRALAGRKGFAVRRRRPSDASA